MIYKLHGTQQNYVWGGSDYLPELLGQQPDGNPVAELWFGDHPQAPSRIEADGKDQPLNEWLAKNLDHALSAQSREKFGDRLPFLLKILDVRLPLSIQLHPNKAQAEAGFAKEEADGIARTAANRNYQDDNHKPESMIALSRFWLLHGFAKLDIINARLDARPSLAPVKALIEAHGLHGAYSRIMQSEQATLAQWLDPIIDAPAPKTVSDNPDYWLHYAMDAMGISRDKLDAGLLSFYLFNIVETQIGEGIFQDAQLPHAYLRGQNIEIMAASNNVLRAGLTPKHVDIPELLRIVDATPITPKVIAKPNSDAPYDYPAPIDDYTIHSTVLTDSKTLAWKNAETTIILNMSGTLNVNDGEKTLAISAGEAVFLTPNSQVQLSANGDCYVIISSNR